MYVKWATKCTLTDGNTLADRAAQFDKTKPMLAPKRSNSNLAAMAKTPAPGVKSAIGSRPPGSSRPNSSLGFGYATTPAPRRPSSARSMQEDEEMFEGDDGGDSAAFERFKTPRMKGRGTYVSCGG